MLLLRREEKLYLSTSLVFVLVILVFISYLQLHVTFFLVLTLVRGVCLEVSEAFERVWYDGLLCKLKQNGVIGNLVRLIKSFLSERVQRVTLNRQTSDWEYTWAGVPQGSILEPLFFLIYLTDLSTNLKSNVKLFANDTSLCFNDCFWSAWNSKYTEKVPWKNSMLGWTVENGF